MIGKVKGRRGKGRINTRHELGSYPAPIQVHNRAGETPELDIRHELQPDVRLSFVS